MQRFKLFRLPIALAVLVLYLLGSLPKVISAQSGWQTPQWIPGLVDTNPTQYPYFVTDATGKVHVFHSQWVNGHFGIVYSSWTVGVGWTSPVDIIVLETGQVRISGAFVDDAGMMNIIFWGGSEMAADIYFTRAPLQDVMRSNAWSTPLRIGPNAIAPTTAAAASDQKGYIVVAYSGNDEGNGVYGVTSQDYGATWSAATPLFFTTGDQLYPSVLQMILTKDGAAHAVWSLGDETGNAHSIYHARLAYQAAEWNPAVVLAEETEYVVDTPSIIEYDASLIVIFHNNFPNTRYMIRSFDGGNTWTSPTCLFEQVGSNGAAALVIDSSNTLHMFFGNRIDRQAVHGLWHSIWQGEAWSAPEAVLSGPQVLVGANNEEGFDPSYAQAIISQGNLLLVIWRHDPMAGPQHIWYTYRYLNTPVIPTPTALTPTASVTSTPAITPSPAAVTRTPVVYDDSPAAANSADISKVLLISLAPALILILFLAFLRRKKQ